MEGHPIPRGSGWGATDAGRRDLQSVIDAGTKIRRAGTRVGALDWALRESLPAYRALGHSVALPLPEAIAVMNDKLDLLEDGGFQLRLDAAWVRVPRH